MRAATAPGMRSGRLCSDAGRQVRSIAGRPARLVSSTSSRASAPQPMTRGRFAAESRCRASVCRIVEPASGGTVTALLYERDRRLDRDRGITAVRIGADGLAELLVERRATDEHDVVVAHPA